jgi:hypothetical protein
MWKSTSRPMERPRIGGARLVIAQFHVAMLLAIPALGGGRGPTDETDTPPVARADSVKPYGEFKGVRLGMTADEVRSRLGKPESSDKAQDFFVFSEGERARVYYDADGRATAVVASYIGDPSRAPSALSVVGVAIEPDANGAAVKTVSYPERGYKVVYSRTGGETPMVFVTLQKLP